MRRKEEGRSAGSTDWKRGSSPKARRAATAAERAARRGASDRSTALDIGERFENEFSAFANTHVGPIQRAGLRDLHEQPGDRFCRLRLGRGLDVGENESPVAGSSPASGP